jgi:hypothetical protein
VSLIYTIKSTLESANGMSLSNGNLQLIELSRTAWGDTLFKAAYSAIPQSTVADCTNTGLVKIYDSYLTSLTGGVNLDILGQVHDSILMQVPLSLLDDDYFFDVVNTAYNYISPELEYNGRKFKIFTDSKIGFNWSGYHPEHNPLGMREIDIEVGKVKFIQNVRGILNGSGIK